MISKQEYEQAIAAGFPAIREENILFWYLWNMAYVFDKLEKDHEGYEAHFELLNEMWRFCWAGVAEGAVDMAAFFKVFGKTYPVEVNEDGETIDPKSILIESYEELRDEVLSEFCIIQLIGAFGTIYDTIVQDSEYGARISEIPINMIYVTIASNGLGFVWDEKNISLPILQDEIAAQMKLIKDLSQPVNYTIANKNIYRNTAAMNSILFMAEEEE